MDLTPSTTPEQLAAELRDQLRAGISPRSLAACPKLLGLAVVGAKAASDDPLDRATAAYGLLREIVVVIDGKRNGPIASLLGLATGSRGTLLKERRHRTAELLFISPAHLRTSDREAVLIATLADEVYAADSAYRLRHRHRTTSDQTPATSRLGIDWLDRHQAYRRVWTPVAALRNDLLVLLADLPDEANRYSDIVDRLITMTWRYAQFLTELERFLVDYGGLWLLADVDSEFAAADAIQRIGSLVPFGEADDSWLRLTLAESQAGELEPFGERIEADEIGQLLLGAWLAWAKACVCPAQSPDAQRCGVHAWLAAADEFSQLIDRDWLAVADWYRLPEAGQPLSPRA